MQIAIPIYERFTALDAIGPYEVLSRLPGAAVTFVASRPGLIRTDNDMLGVQADAALADLPAPDVVVVPGGFGSRALLQDEELLDWLRAAHETSTWTASVCTGSLLLAAAGLLDGLEATTHWAARDTLERLGARYVERRVVEQGKIVMGAGVSAGIDMALTLAAKIAGDEVAQAIQLYIEYDPQPPFDSGSPAKAPASVLELARRAGKAEQVPATG
ncbi:MAG: glutamine amidotransferase [Solirubrobacteraceae bacterium]|nr:glutamine amidotransferase [Solirubrobacteraceae bacterium]